MPACSFVLRLLLCLLLVLNGAMPAFAGVHAHTPPAQAQAAAEAMPCHDVAMPSRQANPGVTAAELAADTGDADTDCCDADTCNCACVQHAQAVLSAMATSAPEPPGVIIRGESRGRRASPGWPVLIRPPIG